jgi:hypothetical protein
VSTHRKFLFAAVGCLLSTAPAFAGPNDLPPGALPAEAADGTLGMALLSAVVSATGTLARGAGTTSAGKTPGTGNFEVIFDRDVTNCTFVTSVGGTTTDVPNGAATATRRSAKANGVFIQTRDLNDNVADKPFHLVVFCNK